MSFRKNEPEYYFKEAIESIAERIAAKAEASLTAKATQLTQALEKRAQELQASMKK